MKSMLAIFAGLMAATPLLAQPPTPAQVPPPRYPAISPYMNLMRRDNPAYLNYYGLVQPQLQTQKDIANLQQSVNTLQNSAPAYPGTGGELNTGKSVGFMTHKGYFMNFGGYNPMGQTPMAGGMGSPGNMNTAQQGTPSFNSPTSNFIQQRNNAMPGLGQSNPGWRR